jgi:hypothetical protein
MLAKVYIVRAIILSNLIKVGLRVFAPRPSLLKDILSKDLSKIN